MTDIDQLSRRMSDIEYRVRQLEKASEPQIKGMYAMLSPEQQKQVRNYRGPENIGFAGVKPHNINVGIGGWYECGRDVCRAPDCPSHKPDPMGR